MACSFVRALPESRPQRAILKGCARVIDASLIGPTPMKVTLERSALLKSLGHVHRVVERRTTIPILSNVLLSASNGGLQLKATDLDLEVTETAPSEVARAG